MLDWPAVSKSSLGRPGYIIILYYFLYTHQQLIVKQINEKAYHNSQFQTTRHFHYPYWYFIYEMGDHNFALYM